MDENPRTFTAPITGTYHVATGQKTHLVQDCTEDCCMWNDRFTAKPNTWTVEFESGPPQQFSI